MEGAILHFHDSGRYYKMQKPHSPTASSPLTGTTFTGVAGAAGGCDGAGVVVYRDNTSNGIETTPGDQKRVPI